MLNRVAIMLAAGFLMATVCTVGAQAPVGTPDARDAAIQEKQRQTSAAYSALQKAQYEAKLAEQDVLNAQDAHAAAQKQADIRRQELETARKSLSAAQAKVAQARKRYDEAMAGVDEAFKKAPAAEKK